MSGPAVNNVLSVHIRGQLNGQRVINTHTYGVKVAPDPLPASEKVFWDAFLGLFETSVYAIWGQLVSTSVGNCVLRGQRVWPTRGQFFDLTPALTTGQLAGTSLPSINATRIRRRNSRGSRKGQGRLFFPGLPADKVSASLLTTGWQATAQALIWPDYFAVLSVLGYDLWPVLVSPHTAIDWAQDPIIQGSVEREVSPQAKRRVGRGE